MNSSPATFDSLPPSRGATRDTAYRFPTSSLKQILGMQSPHPDLSRTARVSTYAKWWIKATIHDYILRSRSLVKMGTTRAQRKLFFGLRREIRKLAREPIQRHAATAELIALIAHRLDVAPGK